MQQHECRACGLMKPATDYRIHKKGYRIGKCRECEREYQRAAYASNPDKIRERKRVSMAKARNADPEKARAYRNAYHAANREAQTEKMRTYYAKRFFWSKAMKLRGSGRASARELAAIWKKQRGLCALTGRRLDRSAQLDHKTPKARGGSDQATNLQWLCEEANLAKRALTDAEFIALCGDVMHWIGKRIELVESLIT
ncbi:HNH endonuclease [Burkholderia multivorans]|nr:HNH endonuclease [Burkholderia multivorans]